MSTADMQHGPDQRAFYKFASADTTLAILRSRSIRYSSPLLFNDPFDVQSGLHFDFDIATLQDKVLDRIGELAAAPEAPPVDSEDGWGKVVLAARSYYPNYGFPRQIWAEMSAPSFRAITAIIEDTQKKYREHWRSNLMPSIRVFCVTEERDNLLMWAHYSKDHTGAVFEFWSLPEEDNALSVARPVIYADSPPPFFSEREWIDDFMGLKKLDPRELYRRYAYVKSHHWSYEKEWRVWYPLANSSEMYDTVPIRQNELRAIYFGCRASDSFINEATHLLGGAFPSARLYRASKSEGAYKLSFHEI
ncbi:MAG: DUF2971 domain-containing protein [Pseudomonadota bacterium]